MTAIPPEAIQAAEDAIQAGWMVPLGWPHDMARAALAAAAPFIVSAAAPVIAAAERERTVAAIRLLDYAVHLHVHGERAPGGDETWAQWERNVRAFVTKGGTTDAT